MVPVVRGRRAQPARAGRARRGVRRARGALRLAVRADRASAPGTSARVASDLQRELIVEEAVAERATSRCWRPRPSGPGFARAAERFVDRARALDGRAAALHRALRDWAATGPRRRYARRGGGGLPPLPRGPGRRRPRRLRPVRLARARALGASPERWGATPVFVYGFDDFTPLELEALEALADRAGADVTVSLPYEPGREAFRAIADAARGAGGDGRRGHAPRGRVRPLRAGDSRDALHAPGARPVRDRGRRGRARRRGAAALGRRRARRGRAVRRGGARAAAQGTAAGRHRGRVPRARALRLAGRAGVRRLRHPVLDRPLACRSRTPALGPRAARAAALRRAATARADDLLAYLRTPGPAATSPSCADRLEAEVRREGVADGDAARASCGRERPLAARRDRPTRRAPRAPTLLERAARRASRRLFAGPYRRRAHVLRAPSWTTPAPSAPPDDGARRAERGGDGRPRRRARRRARARHAGRAAGARGGEPAARPRAGGRARRRPRAPLRGGVRVRPAGGRVPAPRGARAVPPRRRPRASSRRASGLRAAAARGPARPRALPVLRLRLARRARCWC